MQTLTEMSKKSIAAIIFSVLLVMSLFLPYLSAPLVGAEGATEEVASDKVVLGYYTSWNPPAEDFDPNKITHLNYSFGSICWDGEQGNPLNEEIAEGEDKVWPCTDLNGDENTKLANGTIVMYEPEVDLVELENVRALKEVNPDLKTLLSIGGWTLSHNMSDIAADEDARQALADSAVDFIREFGMDGLDLDWEYPIRPDWGAGHPGNAERDEDPENFLQLVKDIRVALDKAAEEDNTEYLLTMAGGQQDWFIDGLPLAEVAEHMDYLAVMTYDTNGTWDALTGHNAPSGGIDGTASEVAARGWTNGNVDRAATKMSWAGVPAEKIVVGLAFYGQAWKGCNPDADGAFQAERGAHQTCTGGAADLGGNGYDIISELVGKDGYEYHWDSEAKVPYLYNEEKGEFISYDNVTSIQHKIDLINGDNFTGQSFGGAMIWDLSTDDANWNLLKTVSSGLAVSEEAPTDDGNQGEITDQEATIGGEEAAPVAPKQKVITEEGVQVYMASDLPAGTTLKVNEADEEKNASPVSGEFAFAGSSYTFDFGYEDSEEFESESKAGFTVSLPIPEGANNPVLGYFNADGDWEAVEGSRVVGGNVVANVSHFSTYGVLSSIHVTTDAGSEAVEVYADGTITDAEGNYKIELPSDLPAGTTFSAEAVEGVEAEGLTVAGVVYNFDFDYNGEEDYVGEFELFLKAEKNASYPKVFKLDTDTEAWNKVGGTLTNGYVPVELEGFSTYGVFTEDAVDGQDGQDGIDGEDGKDGTDGTDGKDGVDGADGKDGADGECNCPDGDKKDNVTVDSEDADATDKKDADKKDKDGENLPKTATNMFNLLGAGLLVIVLGAGAFFIQRRRQNAAE